jgi:hypothetical protein
MGKPHEWFRVTQSYPLPYEDKGDWPIHHAKQYGTTRTACGLDADNFRKDWDQPFNAFAPSTCVHCSEIAGPRPVDGSIARLNGLSRVL